MALRTAWTTPVEGSGSTTRDGGDPLGFRAYATRLARQVVPGLTQVTSTTRGFSLLCLALTVAKRHSTDEQDAREVFQRVERLWVAAEVHHLGDDATFPGKRRAGQLLAGLPSSAAYPLDAPLLSAQLSSGVWGGYRRAASAFALIDGADRRSLRLTDVKLAETGRDLAQRLRAAAVAGVNVGTWTKKDEVSRDVLAKVGADLPVTPDEAEILTGAMEGYDAHHDHSLGHLRAVFDHEDGALTIGGLLGTQLSRTQEAAVPQAQALLEAVERIEFPFREWARTGTEPTWPSGLGDLAIWKAAGPHERDLADLHRRLASAPSGRTGSTIVGHHRRLASARGARPWELGSDPVAARRKVPPDFTLGAAGALFAEGVAPRVGH